MKHKGGRAVGSTIDKKRQSSMFKSTTKRFKEPKRSQSFASDGGWNYTLFSHGELG